MDVDTMELGLLHTTDCDINKCYTGVSKACTCRKVKRAAVERIIRESKTLVHSLPSLDAETYEENF